MSAILINANLKVNKNRSHLKLANLNENGYYSHK